MTAYNEILVNMLQIMEPDGFARWIKTPLIKLSGRTPVEAMRGGDIEQVRDLTRSYLEESFT